MDIANKATRIDLFSLKSMQMRTFHLTWFAFFLCFFGWFGIAPLMAVVREDLMLTKAQIGNTIIASVAITIFARLLIGPLCDKFGPRRTYSVLLILGAIPVMSIGLANSYESFLLCRLAIGVIGAAFVITQYHTTVMFAPNVVGTANATTAGWGNAGGGVTQMVMPLIFSAVLMLGVSEAAGWRIAMIVPGIVLMLTGIAYYFFTRDCPEGDFKDLRAAGKLPEATKDRSASGSFLIAAKDIRVWALFVIYGACFGVELTIHNIAAIYYLDNFELNLKTAGLLAGSFGVMALFARTLGGWLSDRIAKNKGLTGRVRLLFVVLFMEGLMLMLFSKMTILPLAVICMLAFGMFVHMSCGATFGLVPFMNRKALGAVAGIVGAGGNAGAVAAGFLFKSEALTYQQGLFWLGIAVTIAAFATLLVRFSPEVIAEEDAAFEKALEERELAKQLAKAPA
ncbi:MAG: MFS transporter [Salinisphaeraceae bacterium]|nr:MFS transporter [Salinisphaeraceae bacterium]